MNRNTRLLILAVVLAAVLAPVLARAGQTDTNATTTITLYTPTKPQEILTGKIGGTNAVWVSVGQTTNDWVKVSN